MIIYLPRERESEKESANENSVGYAVNIHVDIGEMSTRSKIEVHPSFRTTQISLNKSVSVCLSLLLGLSTVANIIPQVDAISATTTYLPMYGLQEVK